MKTPYVVKPLQSQHFQAVSFSLDATRPEEYFGRLEASLAKRNIEGDVLLDLLACNGLSARRFFSILFDGKKLQFGTMRIQPADSLDSETLCTCKDFYAKNSAKLADSVLSTITRRMLTVP